MKTQFKDESGQSAVIVALVMVGLLAMLGLIFDASNAYAQRRQMQNAADAAALAGARVLAVRTNNSATTEQSILTAVNSYAAKNGSPTSVTSTFIDSSNNQVGAQIGVNGGVPGSATGVRVIAQITFSTFFLQVVSRNLGLVGANAAAQTGVAGAPTSGLMPIGVPRCYVDNSYAHDAALCGAGDQTKTSHVILGQGAQDPSGSSSYRGIVNLPVRYTDANGNSPVPGSCSAPPYNKQDAVDYINAGGYNDGAICGNPNYNEFLDALTGNSNGNAGVGGYSDATYNGSAMYPVGTIILLCIYPEGTIRNGTKATIQCVGFAGFKITDISGSNHLDAVFAGKFITSGPIVPDADDSYSLRKAVQLIQ